MHLSKLAKGLIAGGLGLALLLGGGTFALWSDSASVDSGSIASGTLTLSAGTPTWKNTVTGATVTDLSSYHIVPGDVLAMTADLSITAVGDNLTAVLAVDTSGIGATGATPPSLADIVAQNTTLTTTALATAGTPGTFTVTPATPATVPVTVTITFPSSTTGTDAQGGTVDLSKIHFTLTQQPVS